MYVLENLTEMLKGVLEGCVLQIIAHKETYGYEITRQLNALGFADVVEGTVYTTEILRQYFINHPQSIDKYTFLQNSAFTHWVKEKCSKMC